MTKQNDKKMKYTRPKSAQQLKVGTRVRIPDLGGQLGEIVEFRGELGPNGAPIYGVRLSRNPRRDYIELRDDQLEVVETGGQKGS